MWLLNVLVLYLNHFRAHEAVHEAAHQHEDGFRAVQMAPRNHVVNVGCSADAVPANSHTKEMKVHQAQIMLCIFPY